MPEIPLFAVIVIVLITALLAYLYKDSKLSLKVAFVYRRIALVKDYWKFATAFIVLLGFVYYLIFKFVSEIYISRYLDLTGQIATLIFAIFVGWFAFLEVKRSSLKEGLKEANDYFTTNRSLQRARKLYEDYCDFEQSDFFRLAELLEIYLVLGYYEKEFDVRLSQLRKNIRDDWEKLMPLYLEAAKYLLKEEISVAKRKLMDLVQLAKEDPSAFQKLRWDFKDIKYSPVYKGFAETSDAKIIFDNMISYLQGNIEIKEKFEKSEFK